MLDVLHQLPSSSLTVLAASLREGPLSKGLSRHALEQIGGAMAAELETCLGAMLRAGFGMNQIALVADVIVDTRERQPDADRSFELVLSGPEVPGIPTADTAAVVHTLIEEATTEVLLVGYVVHEGRHLFERLARRMRESSDLKVVFCLDIPRRYGDTSLAGEIVRRFTREFRNKHWPWPELPELYYDPRSLAEYTEGHSSLHAKCVVVDRRVALVTSANFTEAAQHRNIEAGVLVRYKPFVERLVGYLEGLRGSGNLVPCPLEE